MKQRLCFRLSAASCTTRLVLEHEYFGVAVGENEYYSPQTPRERLEYEIFRMVVDVWRKRKGGKYYKISFDIEPHDKGWLKAIVRHARNAWLALLDDNELLARYEFRTAENNWLRFSLSQMSGIAGKALLDVQRRHFDGKRNVARRWKNSTSNKGRDKRIQTAVAAGEMVKELAESHNLTERRIQQIANKKTK